SVQRAQADLRSTGLTKTRVSRIHYRPFDIRFSYYTGNSRGFIGWPVDKIYRHMVAGPNLAICVGRAGQVIDQGEWNIVLCTRHMTEFNLFRRGGNVVFPLYIYDESFLASRTGSAQSSRSQNISDRVIREFPFRPDTPDSELERLFGYVYAILYSPSYRRRYVEFLKIDFPRIPLPGSSDLFRDLAHLGSDLVALHLMESPKLVDHVTTRVGSGEFQVEKVSYSDETVWIDKAKARGFRGVREDVWNFHIGGYQVCEKWLKDRRAKGGKNPRPGRVLTDEDIDHYQEIVVALSETIRIMAEIDEVIDQHGGWPGAFVTEPTANSTGKAQTVPGSSGKAGGAVVSPEARASVSPSPRSTAQPPRVPSSATDTYVSPAERKAVLAALDKAGKPLVMWLVAEGSGIGQARLEEILPVLVSEGLVKRVEAAHAVRYSRA
ncbi:MAG: type ISP restriction/modification enzyme, partial [Planctomycetota bacterium]